MSAHPRLVERREASAALTRAVESVRRGSGCAVLVEGVAGIGKSALLAEVRRPAHALGVRVLAARAGELETGFVFGVVRQLFEPLLVGADPKRRAALLAGPAAPAAAVVGQSATDGSAVGDYAALNSLLWLTVNAAEQGPLLLLVDDLHWCDPPSLRYLAFLLPRLAELNVGVVAAARGDEPGADRLLTLLATDPAFTVVRPRPLTPIGTSALLARVFEERVAPEFARACHRATRGNPLLLRELARAVRDQGLPTDAAHAGDVVDLGPHAIARLVERRRARLDPPAVRLAAALAVLGDGAPLADAAELAGVGMHTALAALDTIGFPEIVCDSDCGNCADDGDAHGGTDGGSDAGDRAGGGGRDAVRSGDPAYGYGGPAGTRRGGYAAGARRVRFVHPLIRSAVYASISAAGRARMHRAAARLVEARGGEADLAQIAAHLLHAVPAGDPRTVTLLRRAAARAGGLGAPAEAAAYLRRCLEEPPPPAERTAVLLELADVTLARDVGAAAGHLHSALRLATGSVERARIAALLGEAAAYVQPTAEALADLERAVAEIEPDAAGGADGSADLRARIAATVLFTEFATRSGRAALPRRVPPLRRLTEAEGPGARMLDCAIAYQDAMTGDPRAVERARRALSSGLLEPSEHTLTALALGLAVLVLAEDPAAIRRLDELMAYARRRGSLRILATACTVRARGWLSLGQLAEAETDAREGVEAARILERLPRTAVLGPVVRATLADALLQRGLADEAEEVLGAAEGGRFGGPVHMLSGPRVRLALTRGVPAAEVAESALAVGRATEELGIVNPAVTQWRLPAALALRAAGRPEEAHELAVRELDLARGWGAPGPVGRALRVGAGLAADRGRALELLREAVGVLEGSQARLEYAEAEADLGTALHAAGQAREGRARLRVALDLADQCDAAPLAGRVRAALRAAGARPRRSALTGPRALTPSEVRVADLAARGHTNRGIAQQLFVTPKTVEVHLSRIYRKLGITARTELARALRP
ncbi:helix-turn-helix transcriptional regulator [Streptomyces sp. NPDC091281]|uniref:helix-turn-helix transcriptional regulator n=1 Tax=Streptomyces sp. NPDC091281 TaxID=3365985 RepID=UPI00380934D7